MEYTASGEAIVACKPTSWRVSKIEIFGKRGAGKQRQERRAGKEQQGGNLGQESSCYAKRVAVSRIPGHTQKVLLGSPTMTGQTSLGQDKVI